MAAAPILFDLPKSPTVMLPVAAFAAGVSPEAFRAYLKHPAVRLLVPRRSTGAWLRTAPVDVVRIAKLAHLVRFGFSIAEAHSLVVQFLDRRIEGIALPVGDVPWPLLENRLRGCSMSVSREPEGISVSTRTWSGRVCARHTTATLTIHMGHLVAEVRARIELYKGGAA